MLSPQFDLIVIGMGLSGLMAAKTAVEMGKKILIIGKGVGSLGLFSNTIDVLGNISNKMTLNDTLSRWIKDHPEHPYAKVGLREMDKALSSFTSLFPPPYSFQAIGDGNCLIPTGAGTLRPTYLIPSTMVPGTSLKEGDGLIIGFKGFKDFYASWVARQLKCRGLTLSLPDVSRQETNATALSRLIEKRGFREKMGREMKKHLKAETCVGLPAFLGIRDPFIVKKDLEELIGAQVFEIPVLPPSIPGMRIFNRFKIRLIQGGGTFLLGYSVSKAILEKKRCKGIEILHPPISTSYSSDCYILATGRFIGGGLKANEEKIFEPIFNLPVSQPKSREEWFQKSFFSDSPHPIHQAGVLTDSSFRAIDEKGERILENVWIAGSILSHHHSVDEKSREGIEISTGYMAAKQALK
jgi:glycerol-3-phosphate dehydrogenase subunit B